MKFNPINTVNTLGRLYKKEPVGFCLVFAGLFLLFIFFVYRFHQARILSFFGEGSEEISTTRTGGLPVHIKSYPLGVDIKVKEADIVKGVWQTFNDAVSHLAVSGRIGEGKNIIIYGHNRNEVLGPIRWAKEGELFELTDNQEVKHIYRVVKVIEVSPDNLEYIQSTTEETLTVYTCSGLFDSKRFIVVAKPV